MPLINCFFSLYEDITNTGAIHVSMASVDFNLKYCFFSHCSRSEQCGGAIYIESIYGNIQLLKSCFEWCCTNTAILVDHGQSVFSSTQSGMTLFSDSSCMFCPQNILVSRNSGFCARYGEFIGQRVNASDCYCQFSSGMMIWGTTKGVVLDCTFSNMTSTNKCDTVCFREHTGYAEITRVIYSSCTHPSNGAPYIDSTSTVSISQCIITSCTNFNVLYYSASGNQYIGLTQLPILMINIDDCIGVKMFQSYNFSILSTLFPLLVSICILR